MKEAFVLALKILGASVVEIAGGLIWLPLSTVLGFFAYGFAAVGILKLVAWLAGS